MSVSLKQSYDIEYNGTANVARMDLFADTAGDLTGLTTVDGITLLQGSTAHVIQTVEDYMMRSNGVWVLQTAGGGGGGGGGSIVPEFFTVTPATGVTVYGTPVKIGNKVTWTGRALFSSSASGDRLAFTLPEDIRPFTKYLFKCGHGGYGFDYTGYVLPNGEVHFVFESSGTFVQADMSWDIITPNLYPTFSEKVASYTGGIEVVENMAIMQISLTLQNVSTGWQNALMVMPSTVIPSIAQCPFVIYRSRNTAQYPDCSIGTNGNLNVYIDTSLMSGQPVDFLCIWEVV